MRPINNKSSPAVPKLRFPEFVGVGEWENLLLGDVYSFKVTNSFSREKLNYKKGLVKNIHYGDIHTKFSTLFDITKELVPFIDPNQKIENINPDSYCIEGDMIFADASEDMNDVGKSIEIVNLNNEKLLSGLHTLLARQKETILVIGFGGYLFKSNNIRFQIQKEAQGTKVASISYRRLSNIKIAIPSQLKEQQKIADCLSSLDALITTQTQKLQALQQHKKGLMQNLFPAEGKTTPKLRFPEFVKEGEWEVIPLKKLAGRVLLKNEGGEISRVFTNSAIHGIVDQREYFDKDIANQSNLENYYVVESGDYVYNPRISSAAPVGPTSKNKTSNIGVMSPLYTVFRFKNQKDGFYEYYFFSKDWHDKIRKASNTGARFDRMSITASVFMNIPVFVPSQTEQQKIADCLSSLDALITTQTQKLQALQQHKKGLMQQLFPATDEAIA